MTRPQAGDETSFRVLLVEDDESFAELTSKRLARSCGFSVTIVNTIESASEHLATAAVDLVLLDLDLPDSYGLDGVHRLELSSSRIPVVVLSANDDPNLALRAVQMGAQDYLRKKDPIDSVCRAGRYAIERQRLLNEIQDHEIQRREAAEREASRFMQMGASKGVEITSQYYDSVAISKRDPALFESCLNDYKALVASYLEHRRYKTDPNEQAELKVAPQNLSRRLAQAHAGPRDVIELHTAAISAARELPAGVLEAFLEETRLLVVSVMGYLAQTYRNYVPIVPVTKDLK